MHGMKRSMGDQAGSIVLGRVQFGWMPRAGTVSHQAWWCVTMISAAQEAEEGGSLEPRSLRAAWTTWESDAESLLWGVTRAMESRL
uniref:Uncharacterized protein n=1 Tax=Spermophilus dauricus TaxID=99837 RepID=A0A8C9Q315_SPEDA